jgi:hypothetical protein
MWPPYIARRYLFCARPRGKTVAVRQVRASVLERVRTAWVGQVALGSFDSAHRALCHAMNLRGRFAQDDDFVGVLKKKIP